MICYDSAGTLLGYRDQRVQRQGAATIIINSLTPGTPPPIGSTPPPNPNPSPSPSDSPSPDPSPSPGPLTLTVTPEQVSLAPLATQRLKVLDKGQDVSPQATWSSSLSTVAVVDSTGLVTAIGAGNAQVVATVSGKQGAANVVVSGPTLQSLVISPAGFTLSTGQTIQFSALGQYSDGSTRDLSALVQWTSTSQLTVTAGGLGTVVSTGSATVTANLGDLTARADGLTHAPFSGGSPPTSPPAITGLNPPVGPLSGGTEVTVTGTNLTGATAVSFGGVPATSFRVNSDISITAISPASDSLSVGDVIVTTSGGTSAASPASAFYHFEMISRPSSTISDLNSVCTGDGLFLAVGEGGTTVYSPDSTSWQTRTIPSAVELTTAWYWADYPIYMVTSPGELHYTYYPATSGWGLLAALADFVRILGAATGNGYAVAVGQFASNPRLGPGCLVWATNSNVSYSAIVNDPDQAFHAVACGSGNRFVTVGSDGLVRWSDVTRVTPEWFSGDVPPGFNTDLNGIAFDGTAFVAVGAGGAILRSTDGGVTFDNTNISSDSSQNLRAITYGSLTGGGVFLAVGESGTLLLSRDGFHWVTGPSPDGTGDLNSVTFGTVATARFVAVGADGTILSTP